MMWRGARPRGSSCREETPHVPPPVAPRVARRLPDRSGARHRRAVASFSVGRSVRESSGLRDALAADVEGLRGGGGDDRLTGDDDSNSLYGGSAGSCESTTGDP